MASQNQPNQRFPLRHRLAHSYEFDAVFNDNQARVSCPSLLLLAKQNDLGFSRLGMIVSKKNTPGSVQRNGIKRQIREHFRKSSSPAGLDIIVMTRPRIKSEENLPGLLQASFTSLVEKIR